MGGGGAGALAAMAHIAHSQIHDRHGSRGDRERAQGSREDRYCNPHLFIYCTELCPAEDRVTRSGRRAVTR